MRCSPSSLRAAALLLAGLALPSLLVAQQPKPDRPPRDAPSADAPTPRAERPRAGDPGDPDPQPARARTPRRTDAPAAGAERARGTSPKAAKVEPGQPAMTPAASPSADVPVTARGAVAPRVRPSPGMDEERGRTAARRRYVGWPDNVNAARLRRLSGAGLPVCRASLLTARAANPTAPMLSAADGYARAFWLGEGSPLLLGNPYALLVTAGSGVARLASGFRYPYDGQEPCEPDVLDVANSMIGIGSTHCAVVSARTPEGEEQNLAVDLPALGAWDAAGLQMKIVQRLQAGHNVTLNGRHPGTSLQLDAGGVETLTTRFCRASEL